MPDNININLARIVYRLLTDQKGWREDSLRRELNIADRTYRKYRKILQEFEPLQDKNGESLIIEVDHGQARYLRLAEPEFKSRERRKITAQFASLNFAQQLMGILGPTELSSATDVFIDTYRAQMKKAPYDLQELIRNADRMFYHLPDAPKDYSEKSAVVAEVIECIIFRLPLNIKYSSANFDGLNLDLKPLTLAMYRSGLYLIAQGSDDEIRIYAVDRIAEAKRLGEKSFEYPSSTEYDPKEYTEGSFGVFRSNSKKTTKFELAFANEKWLQLYIKERRWHPTQEFSNMRDGRLRMTFEVNTEVEVWPWIRQFGDQVEVIKPKRQGPVVDQEAKLKETEAPMAELAVAPEEPKPRRGRPPKSSTTSKAAKPTKAKKSPKSVKTTKVSKPAKSAGKTVKPTKATKTTKAAKTPGTKKPKSKG